MNPRQLPLAWTLSLVAAAPLAADEWHWVYRNRTRPECLTGIPPSNYPYPARSVPVMAISRSGVLLRKSTSVAEAKLRENEANTPLQTMIPIPRASEELPPARATAATAPPSLIQPAARTQPLGMPIAPSCAAPWDLLLLQPGRLSVVDLYQLDQVGLAIDHCAITQVALQLHDDGRWVLSLRADQNRRPAEGAPVVYNPFLHIKRNQFVVRLRCLGAARTPPLTGDLAAGRPVLADLGPVSFWVENGQPLPVRTGDSSPWVQEHFEDIDRIEIEFFYR
jgi:hypothetical protein